MKDGKSACLKIGSMIFGFVLSLSAFAQTTECLDSTLQSSVTAISSDMYSIRASVQEISALTGISISELEWATAANPLFTIILEDQVIPYHEFGPEFNAEQETRSGLFVTPEQASLRVRSQDGQLSQFALNPLIDQIEQNLPIQASKSEHGETEWLWILPVIGGTACWAAAQACLDACDDFIRACPCGGECSCGACGQSGSKTCYTCPFEPPGETGWL